MKDGSLPKLLLKHCVVLVLAMLLVAGTLVLSGPNEGNRGNDLQAQPRQGEQAGSQAGQVMVLRLPAAGDNGQSQGDTLASLARLGVEQGDLLDQNSILVRVPDGKLAAVQKVAGSALQAYTPSARLAPSLAGNGQSRSQSALIVNVTVFQPDDKASVAQAVRRLGGAVLSGETDPGRVLRLQVPGPCLEELSQIPAVVYVEPATTYSHYERPGAGPGGGDAAERERLAVFIAAGPDRRRPDYRTGRQRSGYRIDG